MCNVPLGMTNGEIQDSQITASSEDAHGDHDHGPNRARLDLQSVGNRKGAWSAGSNDVKQWIQVDLGAITSVSGIVIQGRSHKDQWVTAYKVQYGNDTTGLQYIKDIGNNEMVRNFLESLTGGFSFFPQRYNR